MVRSAGWQRDRRSRSRREAKARGAERRAKARIAAGVGSVVEGAASGKGVDDRVKLLEGLADERWVDVDVLKAQSAGGAVGEEAVEGAVAGV